MKKLLLFLVFVLPFTLFAQRNDTTFYEEWESSENMPFSFSIPSISFSKINNKNSFSTGGSINIYVNKHWYFGFFGERMSTLQQKSYLIDTISYEKLRLGYGILTGSIGYVFFPLKKTSIYTSLRGGWAGHSLIKGESHLYSEKISNGSSFVIAPNVDFIFHVTPSFKLCAGLGYRYNTKFESPVFSNKDFNSPYISISLLFGSFPE